MKICIELPTWLGDTVMATPSIENLLSAFKYPEISLIGSEVSIGVLKSNLKVKQTLFVDKNYLNLYASLKSLNKFDLFVSFRSSFRSSFIKFMISSPEKYQFNKNKFFNGHQVEKYNNFINDVLNTDLIAGELYLKSQKSASKSKNRIVGLNPGSTYGDSKRWDPKKFADVAFELSGHYDIIILGGSKEKDIAFDIEKYLIRKGVTNFQNLSGKTSINKLMKIIANLDLFITGDSGPMHLAAAYKIPTISIFGPTNDIETSQWKNNKSLIVKKNLECQPCMKRVCPLNHHKCMKLIEPSDVMSAIKRLS